MIIDIIQKKMHCGLFGNASFFYAIIIHHFTRLFPGTPGVLETSDD